MLNEDPWSPHYQAWINLALAYLRSGSNHQLTKTYYEKLVNRFGLLRPTTTFYCNIVSEILKVRTRANQELFKDIMYKEVTTFCDTIIAPLLSQSKAIKKSLRSSEIYAGTLRDQLALGTPTGLMCGILLYRRAQLDDINWNGQDKVLAERIDSWLQEFLKEFDFITDLLKDMPNVYGWYCPVVRKVLESAWSTALIRHNRPEFLTAKDSYALSIKESDELVALCVVLPCCDDETFTAIDTWKSLASLLYGDPNDEVPVCTRAFYPLCIPDSAISNLLNVFRDFYWIVEDGKMTEMLYTKKLGEDDAGINTDIPLSSYLNVLYLRGYPKLEN